MTFDPQQVSLGDALASISERFDAIPSAVPKADAMDWLEAEADAGTQHIAFRIGTDIYLSALQNLVETMPRPPITRIPDQEPWLVGVSNLRGDIVSVVDLAMFLQLDRVDQVANHKNQGVLLAKATDPTCKVGFLVDEIIGVRRVAETDCNPAPEAINPALRDFTISSTVIGEGSGQILDFCRMADSPEIQDFSLRGE